MHSIDKFHAVELQQHVLLQLSPGALVLNWPTASIQRMFSDVSGEHPVARGQAVQPLSHICRKRSYVRHGLSPTTDVYQSS
jgi:hypothetical protein